MKELKQLMKDVVLHNIGIKVLSLIGALFVWLIIINIDDPYKTKVHCSLLIRCLKLHPAVLPMSRSVANEA